MYTKSKPKLTKMITINSQVTYEVHANFNSHKTIRHVMSMHNRYIMELTLQSSTLNLLLSSIFNLPLLQSPLAHLYNSSRHKLTSGSWHLMGQEAVKYRGIAFTLPLVAAIRMHLGEGQ